MHWKKMLEPVSLEQGTPYFKNVEMNRVISTDAQVCIDVVGIERSPIRNFVFNQVSIQGKKAGRIIWTENWDMKGLELIAADKLKLEHNK